MSATASTHIHPRARDGELLVCCSMIMRLFKLLNVGDAPAKLERMGEDTPRRSRRRP